MSVHVPNMRPDSGVTGELLDEGVDLGFEGEGAGPR